jgi:hypothetical protein
MSTNADYTGTCALVAPSSGLIHVRWHVTHMLNHLSKQQRSSQKRSYISVRSIYRSQIPLNKHRKRSQNKFLVIPPNHKVFVKKMCKSKKCQHSSTPRRTDFAEQTLPSP